MKWKIYQHYKRGKKLSDPIELDNCTFDQINDNRIWISSNEKLVMELKSPQIKLQFLGILIEGPEILSENNYGHQYLWCVQQ